MQLDNNNFNKMNRAAFENWISERDHIKNVTFLRDSMYVPEDDLYLGTGARISYYEKELHSSGYITYWVKITQRDGRSHSLKIEECGNGIAV